MTGKGHLHAVRLKLKAFGSCLLYSQFFLAFFQTPHLLSHPQRRSQHQPKSDTSLMAASLLALSSSSSPTRSSGPQTVRTLLKSAKEQQRVCLSQKVPLQVSPPGRGCQGS